MPPLVSKCARRPLREALVALCAVSLGACAASADGGWWERSRDLLGGLGGSNTASTLLTTAELAAGLKEALEVGTVNVVEQLGRPGGFADDPKVRIPLPQSLASVQSALGALGMSAMLDELEQRLNAAAEMATPKAKDLFLQAIREMTLDDVRGIYEGPDDSATLYFQSKMSRPLAEEMSPIVQASLAETGAVQSYDRVMGRYEQLPFVPDAKANLTTYVVEKGMDGVFSLLAEQEAAIRQDPAKRTTELLRKVFGAGGQ